MPHDFPKGQRPKPIEILLSSGCKAPIQAVVQYKRSPVAYSGTPGDIRINDKTLLYFFSLCSNDLLIIEKENMLDLFMQCIDMVWQRL